MLIAVRWTSAASQVQPISTTSGTSSPRCSGLPGGQGQNSILPNRVEPTTRPARRVHRGEGQGPPRRLLLERGRDVLRHLALGVRHDREAVRLARPPRGRDQGPDVVERQGLEPHVSAFELHRMKAGDRGRCHRPSAWSKSAIRSFTSSSPTETRTRPGPIPIAACSSGGHAPVRGPRGIRPGRGHVPEARRELGEPRARHQALDRERAAAEIERQHRALDPGHQPPSQRVLGMGRRARDGRRARRPGGARETRPARARSRTAAPGAPRACGLRASRARRRTGPGWSRPGSWRRAPAPSRPPGRAPAPPSRRHGPR